MIIWALSSLPWAVMGQRADYIRAKGRAQKKQIMLRWAVSQPRAWKLANQYGFEVVRYTVIRDSSMLPTPERKALGVFKPAEDNVWRSLIDNDMYAGIIAQALFGESFEVASTDQQGIMSSLGKAQELDQRFALSLYAADLSFDAAMAAGWGLTDTDIKENEKYLYRIKAKVPRTILAIDSTAVFIGPKDYKPLPEAVGISATFADKMATVSWDYNALKDFYNAYYVERSSDGQGYYRVTGRPVTKLSEEERAKPSGRVHYIDTLGMNGITYYYRVRGVTPFGETGPPSAIVSGVGHKVLASSPHITRSIVNAAGEVEIRWEFPATAAPLLKGFVLNLAQTEAGPYVPVISDIAASQREVRYNKLFPVNYFTLTAEALAGESTTSFPVLVQPVDSIPPLAPVGLRAVIDSAGKATISWEANTEKDLLGYKVFRSYQPRGEMTPLIDSLITGSTYTDSVSMRITNRKVYYSVTALDQRFNQSAYAQRLAALKADIIPPTSPLFTNCSLENNEVLLQWADAADEDIREHILYRRTELDSAWKVIKRFGPRTPGTYRDAAVDGGLLYFYTLTAKDSSALESKPSRPVSMRTVKRPGDVTVSLFDVYIDRENRYVELFWRDGQGMTEEYQLYKSEGGSPPTLWLVVDGEKRRIVDEKLTVNTAYRYGIRAVTKEGQLSKIKWVDVNY